MNKRFFKKIIMSAAFLYCSNQAQETNAIVPLQSLSYETIQKRVLLIDRMIKMHRVMAVGMNGVLFTTQILQLVHLYRALKQTPAQTVPAQLADGAPITRDGVSTIAQSKAQPGFFKRFFSTAKAGICALPGDIKQSVVSGEALKAFLYAFRELGIYFTMQAVVELFVSAVHHNDDLLWYVRRHARYQDTVDLGCQYTLELMNESNGTSEIVYYKKALIGTNKELIKNMESVIAFMEHKVKRLYPESAQEGTAVADFIFNHTNQLVANLNATFSAETIDYTQIKKLLETFKNDINRECRRFAAVEKEVQKGRLLEIIF
jgi:hypothetical protein